MSLILDAWDLESNFISLGSGIHNTREYLKANIENDEGFFKDGLATFIIKVSTMTKYERKQEDLPSKARIKKLNACWIQRINVLRELLNELNDLTSKKTKDYSKLAGLDIAGKTIEVEYPKLVSNSMLQTRQQFEEIVENLKKLSTNKFNSMIGYSENDIDNWLVEYANRNEDIETTLQNISIDYREYENELFKIKFKQEVIIAPL
jgi:hypothetical protein